MLLVRIINKEVLGKYLLTNSGFSCTCVPSRYVKSSLNGNLEFVADFSGRNLSESLASEHACDVQFFDITHVIGDAVSKIPTNFCGGVPKLYLC